MTLSHFSWVIPNKLAGCDMPGGGLSDDKTLRKDIAFLSEKGIKILLSLERPEGNIEKICKNYNIKWLYYPILDFGIPNDKNGEFLSLIKSCIRSLENSEPICVHCRAGIGRTGMILTCIVGAYLKLNADDAVLYVKKTRPAIETDEQTNFINNFLKNYE
ncbi:MAG: dual specificity protein phosphatase family protein [Chitinispirillaceae bacterium]|nr:dual specificity protein phosphatase family protein [Chitinispirillaceae bacterium]